MKLLSAQEVAKIMGIHESTVRLNAAKGKFSFRSIRVGALWKFPEDEVMEYMYGKDWQKIVGEKANEDSTNA